MGVAVFDRDERHRRRIDRDVVVLVPIVRQRRIGIVRVGERDDERHRPVIGRARVIEDEPLGLVGDLLVIVQLNRTPAGAGLAHRRQVVEAFLDAIAPIGRPQEVGRIDIRRQPFLEAMQLVGPDKVHLAGQAGAIARAPQDMGEGRDVGRKLAGVVKRADPGCQLARHHGKPGRRAKREVAVGTVEDGTGVRQTLHMGRAHHVVAVERQTPRCHLVGLDHQNVGCFGQTVAPRCRVRRRQSVVRHDHSPSAPRADPVLMGSLCDAIKTDGSALLIDRERASYDCSGVPAAR